MADHWKPGDQVATGAMLILKKDRATYHEQCTAEREHALAVHLTKIHRDEAKAILNGIGEKHGADERKRLIDMAVAIKGGHR